jgi:hypothetical protein
MTDPRSKSETLSETTKKYLTEVLVQYKYGRKKDVVNKYIQKGLLSEENSLTLLSRVNKTMYLKNEKYYHNDFVCGTPYILTEHAGELTGIDIKTSWDIWTFMYSKTESLNKDYYWQLQGYMALTGAKKAYLSYCLVDTPDVLINDAKRKFMWNAGILDENVITDEVFEQIEKNCIFSDIPIQERVHTIEIQYNQADIDRLYMRVEECREYIRKTYNYPPVEVLQAHEAAI